MINKDSVLSATITLSILTVIILYTSYLFVSRIGIVGPLLLLLGMVALLPIVFVRLPLRILKADILFGIVDNGILAIFALSGAEMFGVLGAIVGSLVGNAITDGFAGIFEGYEWQKIKRLKLETKRTILTIAIGKLVGCLWGAGVVLTISRVLLKLV